MKIFKYAFLLAMFFTSNVIFADDETVQNQVETDSELQTAYNNMKELNWDTTDNEERLALYKKIEDLMKQIDGTTDELKQNYEDLKANEQSTANKTLTALTTAATGIGGMELAMGLSEQKADKSADQDMDAYLRTFRCTYGDGKSVKGGQDEIELPGGNIPELMNLRNEYVSLAADLKERKTALDMKPGIESEEILDKATMGLYDDEFLAIEGGAYESLYRAKALNSEEDQAKIDANKKEAKNRVIAGGVLAGAGVVGGMVGNALINKNAPKNRSEEIRQKSANAKEELNKYISDEIARCNDIIKQNQDYAKTLKSNT